MKIFVKKSWPMWSLSLEKLGLRFPPKCVTPLRCGYCPDMDVAEEIKGNGVQWSQ